MPMTVAEALLPFGWMRLTGALLLAAGPGLALAFPFAPQGRFDRTARAALAAAMSMAFWPLLFTWLEPLPLRLTSTSALIIAAAGWVLAAVQWIRQRRSPASQARGEACSTWPRVALWIIILAATVLSVWAIRDLVAGMGSDSYHHTLIAQVFADGGRIPANYEPYAPLATYRYHFGFHALAAVLAWFSDLELRLLVPILAEVLVGLAPLTVAYLVEAMGGSRWAAVISALIIAFIAPFPALLVIPGRLPQLAGLVMLPVFMGLVWRAVHGESSGRGVTSLAVLAAGIGLVHYRVAIVAGYGAITFGLVALLAAARRLALARQLAMQLALALAGAVMLISPWIWHVASTWTLGYPVVLGGGSRAAFYDLGRLGGYVLGQPTNWVLLTLLVVAIGIALRKRQWSALALLAWAIALLAFSTPLFAKLRLDAVSAAMSLCVPVSGMIGLAGGVVSLGYSASARITRWAASLSLVAAASVGAFSFAGTIDPRWSYVTRDDLGAMRWIARTTPPEAKFAVNTYNFLFAPRFVIGIDAGYWIPLLAHRSTMTVPMIYTSERASKRDLADSLVDLHALGGHLATDEAVAFLRAQGVDYVFIGSNGWLINEAELAASPHYELAYSEGRAAAYRLLASAEPG